MQRAVCPLQKKLAPPQPIKNPLLCSVGLTVSLYMIRVVKILHLWPGILWKVVSIIFELVALH